jgi:hypothetical protein
MTPGTRGKRLEQEQEIRVIQEEMAELTKRTSFPKTAGEVVNKKFIWC